MKAVLLPLLLLSLASCASSGPRGADRLAIYQAHAGEPVKQIRYFNAMGWDRIDDEHILLNMRPRETWLLTISGPCLDWAGGSPLISLSSQGGWVSTKFDRIHAGDSPVSCRIEEIRPVDVQAVRAAEAAWRDQAPSGT